MSKSKTAESSDEDGNVSDASVGTAPPPPPAAAAGGEGQRPKKMRKKIKAKAEKGVKPVLSFGHEDEEDSGIGAGKASEKGANVFRVKKTKASKVGGEEAVGDSAWLGGFRKASGGVQISPMPPLKISGRYNQSLFFGWFGLERQPRPVCLWCT